MSRLAVLLRAVNVGGTGKLAMADFRTALDELGYGEPKTLGAAGSAIVRAHASPAEVEAHIEAELRARFDLPTEVFARTNAELTDVLAANPFEAMARELPSGLLVVFLKGEPEAGAVEALRSRIVGPEEVAAGPRSLFIAYGEGMGRSKLTGAIVQRAIGLSGTGRNWNTVQKLAELAR